MKGAINASVALVMGVVILLLAASGITTTFNLADAFDPLGYKERQAKEADATIALQKSLDCAYYRCLSGCEDPRTINACGYVNGVFNQAILDRFCDKRFQDKDGRICGSNSLALPISTLSPVKYARVVFSNGKSTFKFDNNDKKSIDSCVGYLNRDDCNFIGKAPLGDIEHVFIEIPPELFTKKDAGVCHGIDGAEVTITASQLYIWSTDVGTGFLHTSLRTCGIPPYQCTDNPLQCNVRLDKDKCEDNDSGCKWDKSTLTCKPSKVGQGEGPRPCELFTDEKKCSANGCTWKPKIS